MESVYLMETIIQYIKIARLICKERLLGLSSAEKQELQEWREQLPGGHPGFPGIQPVSWQKLDARYARVDINGEWEIFRKRLKKRRNRRLSITIGVAASICLLLGTAWLVFLKSTSEMTPVYVSVEESEGIYLILSSGEKLSLADGSQVPLDKIEGNATIHKSGMEYVKEDNPVGGTEQNTLVIPAGAFYYLILTDGTKVWLNAETKISYPIAFTSGIREVAVSGEAYFEVAKDPARPFVVKTDHFDVKVLGTSFSINTYGDNGKVYTALKEGLVEISNGQDNTQLIRPGQVIELDVQHTGSTFRFSEMPIEQLIAWKDGQFCFRKTALVEMLKQIERYYDVRFINADGELQEYYTGTISRNVSLETLLSVIQESTDIKFEIEGRIVYIEKKRD